MKVFKMDDCDWVAAENEEKAIKFYINETGVSEEELNVRKTDLKKDGMYYEVGLNEAIFLLEKLATSGRVKDSRILKFAYGDCGLAVWMTFEEVLKRDKGPYPCIIATTEW